MITLINNYKYDNKYDYVKLFATKSEQLAYFNTLDKILINDDNYVKEHTSIKVPYSMDYLVSSGTNYLMFNNGYKNIFAFIVKKEYVSYEVTKIHFEIDVIQTYLFDIKINNSFIERKKCLLTEICDYDEGIEIGEHKIDHSKKATLTKEYDYLAMFNGIKEQLPVFENGKLVDVINTPSNTFKPLTIIDSIQYPILIMELQETYPEPTFIDISTGGVGTGGTGGSSGDWENGYVSSDGFRFMKGYEGYAPYEYNDGYGYMTIGYGVTKHGEPDIYQQLKDKQPVSEELAAKTSFNLKRTNYAMPIIKRCKYDLGITKQNEFDALIDLAFNCGYGVILQDNALMSAIKTKNPSAIRTEWEKFRATSNGIPSEGLRLRRIAECNIFLDNNYEFRDILKIDSGGSYNGIVTENNGHGWLPT